MINNSLFKFIISSIILGSFFTKINAQTDIIQGCDLDINKWQSVIINQAQGKKTIEFNYNKCNLDLSKYSYMGIDVENKSSSRIIVDIVYNGPYKNHVNQGRYFVSENETKQNKLILNRVALEAQSDWLPMFKAVRGLPANYVKHWNAFDLKDIKKVTISISWENHTGDTAGEIRIKTPYGVDDFKFPSISFKDQKLPILDEMGQHTGSQWEDKLQAIANLKTLGEKDLNAYKKSAFSSNLSKFGGWKEGPKMKATGYFYTQKYNGKWWFVDPDGYLFWSLGVTGAGNGSATPITSREQLFPSFEEERAGKEWSLLNSSFKKNQIDFYELNLKRKYGNNWENRHAEVTSARLKNWGINTYGAWSTLPIDQRHPYTLIVHPNKKGIGKIENMTDPFSEDWVDSLKSRLALLQKYKDDSWLLGVFVDNELHWGNETAVAFEVLKLKNNIPARKEMESFLQKRHQSIEKLNASWGSQFESFQSINEEKIKTYSTTFEKDMLDYFDFFANTYFRIVEEELHKVLPNHLYFGSRFHDQAKDNKIIHKAASRHCDVISFNIYEYSVKDFKVYTEVDKPSIIGEFHFGTGTHGVWGTGLRSASDLKNQAELYQQYIKEALSNPSFIGAHWFQWSDQPATGRSDGENFRIGMVNVTDQPYQPFVEAIKKTSQRMYEMRNK
jgi:hypothetical protein